MSFLITALGALPEHVLLVLVGGCLVLVGAALYIVGRVMLAASDEPARRLTQLLLAAKRQRDTADQSPLQADLNWPENGTS